VLVILKKISVNSEPPWQLHIHIIKATFHDRKNQDPEKDDEKTGRLRSQIGGVLLQLVQLPGSGRRRGESVSVPTQCANYPRHVRRQSESIVRDQSVRTWRGRRAGGHVTLCRLPLHVWRPPGGGEFRKSGKDASPRWRRKTACAVGTNLSGGIPEICQCGD